MAIYSRVDRVSDEIQKFVAIILDREIKDPRIDMITVTDVRMSKDLSIATVYVTFLTNESQQDIEKMMHILKQASGFVRSKLSGYVRLRVLPEIRFFYDNSIKRGMELSNLIDKTMAWERKNKSGGELD